MGKLSDDETRLAPYDKLSRGKKQEIDLERRATLKRAEADKESFGNKAANAATQLHPFLPQKRKDESAARMAESASLRADKLRSAKSEADYEDVRGGKRQLFGDDVVHKIKDGPAFRSGGMVRRGYGAARGK